jgi:hypothetical protein
MLRRKLVYLGPAHEGPDGAPDAEQAPPETPLRGEGQPLAPGAVLDLVRRRSPWGADRDVERVIVGSHSRRADVLLEGDGVRPEHVRFYLPRSSAGPDDLRALAEGAVWINSEPLAVAGWRAMAHGDEVRLAGWRFRYERIEEP